MEQLQEELLKMKEEDQKMRKSGEWNKDIDRRNTERMKDIIKEYGWPTISKVGEEGELSAWLLVQHADHDLEFQEYCLTLMQQQPSGEVNPIHVAMLEDRIKVNNGLPQIYGTQFSKNEEGRYILKPIENKEGVEERRASVGLPTLKESIELMNAKNN